MKKLLVIISFIACTTTANAQFSDKVKVAFEILESAPAYKKITKGLYQRVKANGGTSFGINVVGTPKPNLKNLEVYSKNYLLNLHESYPDRMVTIARFSYHPQTGKLYQMNTGKDTKTEISFDRKLILKLKMAKD